MSSSRAHNVDPTTGKPTPKKGRILVACSNCRRSRTKCMSVSPETPCYRCIGNNWKCEYLSMAETPESVTHASDHTSHGVPSRRPRSAMAGPAGYIADDQVQLSHPYASASESAYAYASGSFPSGSAPAAATQGQNYMYPGPAMMQQQQQPQQPGYGYPAQTQYAPYQGPR
uniref:Zn(2)-C6 fungal-type domain-containing protein n=1 Tax=Mycena chlorophos TaxID=658473 RepID=A0ABQ0LNZ3_MYCCL|nr:predicted protein [Mycena chlorophos]